MKSWTALNINELILVFYAQSTITIISGGWQRIFSNVLKITRLEETLTWDSEQNNYFVLAPMFWLRMKNANKDRVKSLW